MEDLFAKKYSVSGYNGYDLSEEMLSKSKERLKNFKGDLNLINSSKISTPADFTLFLELSMFGLSQPTMSGRNSLRKPSL